MTLATMYSKIQKKDFRSKRWAKVKIIFSLKRPLYYCILRKLCPYCVYQIADSSWHFLHLLQILLKMAAAALDQSSRQVESVLNSTNSNSNSGDNASSDSSSPKLYVKSGKPSSRLRQSQSTSNLQARPRAQSADGTTSESPFTGGQNLFLSADAYANMFSSNSLHTLNSSTSAFPPQNPPTTPRFTLYPSSGSGGNAPIPPPPPPSISSTRVPIGHSPILHTLQKQ
ncbi:hypothetical protein QR680_013727 [Steinernema hermaphroditum]|uniref:Uncharacterized protein n=1 Tax=Steinernema hermaphroditum TaxID=289476 RepID=A0AA39I827_9BILA|nr:hypothetical protein QR680_013727 [Steinernema hermaphroditum]